MPALVLVAHGSHLNANSAKAAYRYAELIRQQGQYDFVTVCCWKEEPSLRQVLRTVPHSSVTVLPAFMSEGYFTETVIPRELGLAHRGRVPAQGVFEQVGEHHLHYLRPYGTHSAMRQVILARALEVLPDANAHDTALILLGHGTTENDHSREAIVLNADLLRQEGHFAEVHDFYLDEEPRVTGWASQVHAPRVVIVPFFASEGWHTQETIPQELGLQGDITPFPASEQKSFGQTVYYAKPVGTHTQVAVVLLEMATGAFPHAPQPDRVLESAEWRAERLGELGIQRKGGQVVLHHVDDDPQDESLRSMGTLAELRAETGRTADGKHRPIRSLRNLPRGWRAELSASHLPEALRLIYPALIEETQAHASSALPLTPWEQTAQRQTGLYRTVRQATSGQVQAEVKALCSGCLRTPLWSGGALPEGGFPCAEACTLLVAGVRDRVNAEKPHLHPPTGAFVSLVGAGPGDPELLTLKARRALQEADVVLYDALVNPAILHHAPQATLVEVGKRGFKASTAQDDIHALMVQQALEGKRVVRLKGGDPFVFGRGAEEALACRAARIPFEVVPGISSALAGPAYAGIPVTHRGVARSFAVLTGTDQEGVARYRELKGVDTLVFLMALKNLEDVCADLLAAGRSPETPVATVASATLPGQKVVTGTLTNIAQKVREAGIQAPALTVVGNVVNLRESLDWFTPAPAPLSGLSVVVTRTRQTPSALAGMLREQGAEVHELPLIHFEKPSSSKTVIGALRDFEGWIALTSEQAVDALFEVLGAEGLDARALARVKIAAVGTGTATRLQEKGLRADFIPTRSGARHLGEQLPAQSGELVLHFGSQDSEQALAEALAGRGIEYHPIETFRTRVPELTEPLYQKLRAAHLITLASAAGARHFAALAGTRWRVAAIGPQTELAARELGFADLLVAEQATLEGLTERISEHWRMDRFVAAEAIA